MKIFWCNIYFKSPQFNPVSVLSSTGFTKEQKNLETENNLPQKTENYKMKPVVSPEGSRRKKKRKNNYDDIIHFRQQQVERRGQRHRERIEQKDRMFKWFQDNITKKVYLLTIKYIYKKKIFKNYHKSYSFLSSPIPFFVCPHQYLHVGYLHPHLEYLKVPYLLHPHVKCKYYVRHSMLLCILESN